MKTYFSRFWTRRSPKPARGSRTTTSRPNAFAMDVLEDRRLTAVNIFYDDGIRGDGPDHPELRGVHIVGTAGADRIDVTEKNGQLRITAARPTGTGLTAVFSAADVPKIFFCGGDGDDIYTSKSSIETIVKAGNGNDTIHGGWGKVQIEGEAGNDVLSAGNLAYGLIFGGYGNDTLTSGDAPVTLSGDAGDDRLVGGHGDDILIGGDGIDTLLGGEGNDQLSGGKGLDELRGGDGDDYLSGDENDDVLFGDGGMDALNGGNGHDLIDGGRDGIADYIFGNEDNDVFRRDYEMIDGVLQYFDDAIYDFNEAEGDRYYYDDFDRLTVEYPGMKLTDILSTLGAAAAGFAAPQDAVSSDDLLADASWTESDPNAPLDADSNLYLEPSTDDSSLADVDMEISLTTEEPTFDQPIDALSAPTIDSSPALSIEPAVAAPITVSASLASSSPRLKTSLRWF